MARFLFIVPPLTGHTNPTVAVAGELEALGHEVAWLSYPSRVRPLLPDGARLFALPEPEGEEALEVKLAKATTVRGLTALKFLWEEFLLPMARHMLPLIEPVLDDYQPDLTVVDHQAFGGAMALRRAERPFASFMTTSASIFDPIEALPKVQEWIAQRLWELEDEAGLPHIRSPERSHLLNVVFSTPALTGPVDMFSSHYAFVGPAIRDRPDRGGFPWERLDPERRKLLVSLGTLNAERGRRFFSVVAEAFANTELQVVVSAPEELLPDPPPNVIRERWLPQLQLLPHMHAVLCHAGHNTVAEALANALPLVMTPIKDDQPIVAQQVVDAGAGLRLRFSRVTPAALRDAVFQVLEGPSFKVAAEHIRDSFARAGGAKKAAELLDRVAETGQAYDRGAP